VRVLFVTGSYPPMLCGVGDYTAILAVEIAKHSYMSVAVLTSVINGHETTEDASGIQLLPMVQGWRLSELPKVIGIIRRWRPDIVHVQYHTLGCGKRWMPYLLPLFLKLCGLKVVQTWHESPTRFRSIPNSLALDALIGVEPDYLQHLKKRYRWLLRRKSTCFIPVGSNIPRVELTESERTEIREHYVGRGKSMLTFFGFASPAKRVESLFEIADPNRDTIVLLTQLDEYNNPYHQKIMGYINESVWAGKVVITGFLSAKEVARALCASDAVVFPFQNGVGTRNGSYLAAISQGTLTITTSHVKQGYDPVRNVFYARPGDNEAMRSGLSQYEGTRAERVCCEAFDWAKIADEHIVLYRSIVKGSEMK